jgi:hypothetical protein
MHKIAACKVPSLKERGKNADSSGWRNDDGLIVIRKRGEMDNSHQKKVQKVNELIAMRVARKMRLKELMEKRAGTFF